MRSVFLAIILVLFALNARSLCAKNTGAFGGGVLLGRPIGLTVKYWLSSNAAIDFGLGFENDFKVYSDFLWHESTIFPQPAKGTLTSYLGLGLRYEEQRGDDEIGFRAVAGSDYWLPSHPIEISWKSLRSLK